MYNYDTDEYSQNAVDWQGLVEIINQSERVINRKFYACELVVQRRFVDPDDLPLYWEIIDELLQPSGRHSFSECQHIAEGLIIRK